MSKKTRKMRHALLMSVISMMLCCAMLVGTTFAWFTDEVSSTGNIIKSGTLDVEMYWADGKEDPDSATWTDASDGAIFNYDLWEPGYVQVCHVKIANVGTLALKYQLHIVANGEVSELADVVDVYYADPAVQVANRAMTGLTRLGTLTEVLAAMSTTASGELEAGDDAHVVTLALKMQETAGNEYQDMSIGTDFSVKLVATQLTAEEDSFDDQYDKDAGYNYGKTNVGPYKLNVLSGGFADYDEATKTYTVAVETVAQGGWNAAQGNYYAGYTVNVAGYDTANATVSFDKPDGTTTVWKLANEERDGFIKEGVHQQWTSVGTNSAYRYDIDGDGVTDFTVVNDASNAKVEVATAEQLQKVLRLGKSVILTADIPVDKWIMFSETLSVANGNIITIKMDGLTIDGNGHTLTVKSIESAGNGNRLFYDASNLNIYDLTIKYAEGLAGGIGLTSGVISNVNFVGGNYSILPGTGDVKIENCTFASNSTSIYFEGTRDNLTVTGCTFNNADDANVILLRGDVEFTNNTVNSGRTVNIVSGSPVVTGNNFNDVRLKVYEAATATVFNNTINNLAFETTTYLSIFNNNIMSAAAQAALNAARVSVDSADELAAALEKSGNVVLAADIALTKDVTVPVGTNVVLDLNGKNITMESADAVAMITNKGSLTINGTGKITYTFNGTPNATKAANTIENRGVLVVNGGEISNTGKGNQIGYGIDNQNGSTLTVNGGKITATGSSYYDGIRLMCGSNNETTVTVNDGEISSIWAQNPSANKATEVKGTVIINGGTVNTTYYENYTTVKVAEGVTATVTPYGAGNNNTTSAVVDGYTVYSFVH